MYGGKFAFQNRLGLACSGNEIYHFCFVLLCIRGQIPSTSPPRGLYLEGRFNGGFFALRYWGAYIWRGLLLEFYGTRLLVDNAVIKSYTYTCHNFPPLLQALGI